MEICILIYLVRNERNINMIRNRIGGKERRKPYFWHNEVFQTSFL